MVARSKSSNQRPDTLMQDRKPTARRKPLATRGRTIHWVKNGNGRARTACPLYSQEQTSSGHPGMSVSCQWTKPLAREGGCGERQGPASKGWTMGAWLLTTRARSRCPEPVGVLEDRHSNSDR